MVLRDIRDLMQSMGKDIKMYGLLDLFDIDGSSDAEYRKVRRRGKSKQIKNI